MGRGGVREAAPWPRVGGCGFLPPEACGQGGDPRLWAPLGEGRLWAAGAAGLQARAGAWCLQMRLGWGRSDGGVGSKELGGDHRFGSSYNERKALRSRFGGARKGGFSQLGFTTPATNLCCRLVGSWRCGSDIVGWGGEECGQLRSLHCAPWTLGSGSHSH